MRLINKSLTESVFSALTEGERYVIKYWESEADRDDGFSETEYITADDLEDAIAQTREMYYDNNWASCELGEGDDEEVSGPLFGIYPEDKKVTEERFGRAKKVNESVSGDFYVCKRRISHPNLGTLVNKGQVVDFSKSSPKVTPEEIDKYYDKYTGDLYGLYRNGKLDSVYASEGDADEAAEEVEEWTDDEVEVKKVSQSELNESVTVTAGSTYVTVDETGVMVDDNGTTVTVNGGATVNIENNELVPEVPMGDMGAEAPLEPVEGELPMENEESAEVEEPAEAEGEEEVIEPSEELIEPEEDEDDLEESAKLKENAGDPNDTVEIFKNPEFDYSIKDVTELDNVDVGDVRSIDMFSILNGLEERLQERYGTENWGLLNTFQTRQGKHKKTNESYASAILDISIPKSKRLQELNTVLTVEVYGDKALKECVVKDARYNKRIERFCGKTKDPVKFLEGVMVDLVNNRAKLKLTNYQPMTEDTKTLKEEVADEAYEVAEYIENRCGGYMQEGTKDDESILRREDFDTLFFEGVKKIAGLSDEEIDAYFNGELGRDVCGEDDAWDLEVTVRSIMGYDGYETIYESDEERNADEGDLVYVRGPVNEDVEFMVGKPYEDKGMNFADGKAIEKDVKRQERHIKQHKALGKATKKFKVEKEPDQKNTQGKKVEDLADTVEPSKEGGKKKKSPSKKKKAIKESLEDNQSFWAKGFKPGDRLKTSVGEVEILELNQAGDYILVNRGTGYQPFVAAWCPCLDGDELYWGQGHYYDNEEDAREYFNKTKLGEGVNEDAERVVLNPEKNFGYTDPYGVYYKDDNGNLYKSVDNGNELYVCTKAGEPLKDVDPSKYILSDKALNELTEAKGLLDDEDTPAESDVEGDSEDLVDVDDELEEGATEVAIFHRKPASIDAMKQAEANGITVNKSNYKVIGTKELSGEEFDDFAKHLSSGSYSWLKDMYKAEESNSGTFNCIEVKNTDDGSMTLLVDPNGYDYARYVAMKPENVEEKPVDVEEEPIEEPEEAE